MSVCEREGGREGEREGECVSYRVGNHMLSLHITEILFIFNFLLRFLKPSPDAPSKLLSTEADVITQHTCIMIITEIFDAEC